MQSLSAATWALDVERWPGPDRRRWRITRDVVEPSPDGRFACVLYSCHEIRLHCEVGLLALLAGPPGAPKLLLRPRGFLCMDLAPTPSARWLGDGRFVVVLHLHGKRWSTSPPSLLDFVFLDTAERTYARVEAPAGSMGRGFVESGDTWVVRVGPDDSHELRLERRALAWRPWSRLRA